MSSPVEGALEEAREAFLEKLRYWLADPLNTNTIGMPAVERDLDALVTAAQSDGYVQATNAHAELLAAARSGHDGLLTAIEALSLCSDNNCLGCQGIIARALSPEA